MIVRTVGWDNGFGDEKFMVEKTVATDKPGGVKRSMRHSLFRRLFMKSLMIRSCVPGLLWKNSA